jgi:hypothetical protein
MRDEQVIAAGTCADGASVTLTSRTARWMIIQRTGAADATATFDSKYTIQLAKHNTAYVMIDGNYQNMAAVGNAIDYIVFG